MILVPFLPFRRAAEVLETSDLQLNIVSIKTELEANRGVWHDVTLAEYGLTSLRVLGGRGFRSDLYYKLFKDNFKGVSPDPPIWVKDFCVKHRQYLVLLGWMRYFEERGAKHYWCQEHQVEHVELRRPQHFDGGELVEVAPDGGSRACRHRGSRPV